MSHNDHSDNEIDDIDDYEFQRLQKWDTIKHFTQHDYLSCPETRQILTIQWNQKFDVIEPHFVTMWNEYLDNVKTDSLDILSLADNVHMCDFVALIRHHTKKDWDISVFEDDPSLADPLVAKYDAIQKEREQARKKKLQENMAKANKTFNWGTKKYQ